MMKYTVYRTVNLINGKFYIGVHKTDKPNDGYLGSGKLIQRAVSKYGPENFRKEVLEIFDNPADAFTLEKRLVGEQLGSPGCYNLKEGGEGGYDYINLNGLSGAVLGSRNSGLVFQEKYRGDPVFRERHKKMSVEARAKFQVLFRAYPDKYTPILRKLAQKGSDKWRGKFHTAAAKKVMSNVASKRIWLHRDGVKRLVNREVANEFLSTGWSLGKRDLPQKKERVRHSFVCENCGDCFISRKKNRRFCGKPCSAKFYHRAGVLSVDSVGL